MTTRTKKFTIALVITAIFAGIITFVVSSLKKRKQNENEEDLFL
jgi:hypothetical protein